jgi:ketosteroid isomerase-like protein
MAGRNADEVNCITEASNRRDIDALLESLDPEVEWTPAFPTSLGEGAVPVYRGHDGVRKMFREFYEALDEIHADYSEVRELDDRVVAIGRVRTRGTVSGATTESPFAMVADFRDGKATRVRTYLDPEQALADAELRE